MTTDKTRRHTEAMTDPAVAAARIVLAAATRRDAESIDPRDLVRHIDAQAQRVADGDMRVVERSLAAQAVALEQLAASLIARGMTADLLPQAEAFLKLGLRAMSQARQTAETLAVVKNPSVIYARQANFATGAQQVVNHAPAREIPTEQGKLLEGEHGERMDAGEASKTARGDSAMAPVGAIDRTAD